MSLCPLAALAQTQEQLRDGLLEPPPSGTPDLQAAWGAAANALRPLPDEAKGAGVETIPEEWLVLLTCRDEKRRVEVLERFQDEGLPCRA